MSFENELFVKKKIKSIFSGKVGNIPKNNQFLFNQSTSYFMFKRKNFC